MHNNKVFESQQKGEKVITVTRKHPIVLIPLFLMIIFTYIFGFLIIFTLPIFIPAMSEGSVPNYLTIGMSLYFLFATLIFFIEVMVYYLHFNIVTNENIVDVNQHTLFSRKISELSLEDIEDVSASQVGFFQSIFKYGNVMVQTAAENTEFIFEKIPNPYEVAKQVMELRDEFIENQTQKVRFDPIAHQEVLNNSHAAYPQQNQQENPVDEKPNPKEVA